jgi:hypothetical protein
MIIIVFVVVVIMPHFEEEGVCCFAYVGQSVCLQITKKNYLILSGFR